MVKTTDSQVSEHQELKGLPSDINLLRTLLEAIDQGVMAVNPASEVLATNRQLLEIWNIPPEMAKDNPRMMQRVIEQLVEPAEFVETSLRINRDPQATIRDELELLDGRVIQRFSQPCFRNHSLVHRVWCFRDVTAMKAAEREYQAHQKLIQEQQQRLIELQQAALAELSTPLIPITDEILVMPLIGAVDTERAALILQTLLEGVSNARPHTVILDITGVVVVDTQVATALIQAANAVRLLGTSVALTGISPHVAHTLIQLGLGGALQGIETYSSLQVAVMHTLTHRSKR